LRAARLRITDTHGYHRGRGGSGDSVRGKCCR
jgi:hypothetical protein